MNKRKQRNSSNHGQQYSLTKCIHIAANYYDGSQRCQRQHTVNWTAHEICVNTHSQVVMFFSQEKMHFCPQGDSFQELSPKNDVLGTQLGYIRDCCLDQILLII